MKKWKKEKGGTITFFINLKDLKKYLAGQEVKCYGNIGSDLEKRFPSAEINFYAITENYNMVTFVPSTSTEDNNHVQMKRIKK